MEQLPQRTNANVPWRTIATPTTSTASTVSTLATPMSSVESTSSQLSTAAVQRRPVAGLQTALPTPETLTRAFGTWGRGRRTSKKDRKTRGHRKSRRGGFTKGAIPYGKRCVFPDASMTTETRTFTPGELVCYRDPSDMATDKSATYLFNVTPVVHRIKQTIDDVEVYAPWQYVGKLVDASPGLSNESSGAADWGNWANVQPGTQVNVAGPLLTRSNATGIGQGRRSRKSRKVTRRR